MNRLIGQYRAAVRHVPSTRGKLVGVSGNENLVCELFGGTVTGSQDPEKPRFLFSGNRILCIDAPWVDSIFAAEIARLHEIIYIVGGTAPVSFADIVGLAVARGIFDPIWRSALVGVEREAVGVHRNV